MDNIYRIVPVYDPIAVSTGLGDRGKIVNGELLGFVEPDPISGECRQAFNNNNLCMHGRMLDLKCTHCVMLAESRVQQPGSRYRHVDMPKGSNKWERDKMATTRPNSKICPECKGEGYSMLISLMTRRSDLRSDYKCLECMGRGIVLENYQVPTNRTIEVPSDHTSDWDFWSTNPSVDITCKCGKWIKVYSQDYKNKHGAYTTELQQRALFDKFLAHKLPEVNESERFEQIWDECFPRAERKSRLVTSTRAIPGNIKKGAGKVVDWGMIDHPYAGAIIFTAVILGIVYGLVLLAGAA